MDNYYELESPVKYKYKNNKDIIIFKNVINKNDCQFIIDTIEKRCKWEDAKTFGNVEDYRKTQIVYLTQIFGIHSELFKAHSILGYSFKTCIEQLMKIYKYTYNNDIATHFRYNGDEGFQILKYEGNNYYKEHVDGGFNLEVKRSVSFIFYLNDNFKGGETYFPRQDVTISPSIGDVLVFPSGYTHPHEAKQITEGTKYSAVIWSY
jgi:Rps23 Pro-64 3,4-dihydroxylase Tpa1-like proline 4-hydroxylase